jgi:hypothetical protein
MAQGSVLKAKGKRQKGKEKKGKYKSKNRLTP